jgi:hypothetical protein
MPKTQRADFRVWIRRLDLNAPLVIHGVSFNISFMFRAQALVLRNFLVEGGGAPLP